MHPKIAKRRKGGGATTGSARRTSNVSHATHEVWNAYKEIQRLSLGIMDIFPSFLGESYVFLKTWLFSPRGSVVFDILDISEDTSEMCFGNVALFRFIDEWCAEIETATTPLIADLQTLEMVLWNDKDVHRKLKEAWISYLKASDLGPRILLPLVGESRQTRGEQYRTYVAKSTTKLYGVLYSAVCLPYLMKTAGTEPTKTKRAVVFDALCEYLSDATLLVVGCMNNETNMLVVLVDRILLDTTDELRERFDIFTENLEESSQTKGASPRLSPLPPEIAEEDVDLIRRIDLAQHWRANQSSLDKKALKYAEIIRLIIIIECYRYFALLQEGVDLSLIYTSHQLLERFSGHFLSVVDTLVLRTDLQELVRLVSAYSQQSHIIEEYYAQDTVSAVQRIAAHARARSTSRRSEDSSEDSKTSEATDEARNDQPSDMLEAWSDLQL